MANPQIFLISCFSLLALTLTLTLALSSSIATPHNELKKYGFPIGLLPAEIESYTLNRTSGEFALYMSDTCRITLPPDNYLATYSREITGKIVENRIAELNGISVRAFFKWWGITGIRSNGEKLTFEVGVVTANYPSKNFDETPHCEGGEDLLRRDWKLQARMHLKFRGFRFALVPQVVLRWRCSKLCCCCICKD